MNLFLKTLYMLTVMIMTGMMMVIVLICTPEFHTKLSAGFYQQSDMSYSQFVMQSWENPGIYLAQVTDEDDDKSRRSSVKRELAWDYHGNNTGYLKILIDYARPQHDPWPGSVECMGLKVSFARRRTLPRTALASFPGSGNTWLRYLIQSASGLFTGSIYNDRQLASQGFYGESDTVECGCTIAVKTHGYTLGVLPETREKRLKALEKFYGRGILLLRNPYDTLIAFRNYQTGGHLGIASPLAFTGAVWARFVNNQVIKWGAYASDWITSARNLHVVNFENMQENPNRELQKILHFLHLRPDSHRIKCVLANMNGVFRRVTPEDTFYRKRDPYTEDLHMIIDKTIKEVNAVLIQHGWPPLPTHLYSYHIESKNYSTQNIIEKTPKSTLSLSSQDAKQDMEGSRTISKVQKGVPASIEETAKRDFKFENMNSISEYPLNKKGSVGREKVNNGNEKVIKLYPWMKSR